MLESIVACQLIQVQALCTLRVPLIDVPQPKRSQDISQWIAEKVPETSFWPVMMFVIWVAFESANAIKLRRQVKKPENGSLKRTIIQNR